MLSVYNSTDHTFVICAYKKSSYLEECIKSLMSQTIKSKVIMVTSTPNDSIQELGTKYNIPLYINEGIKGIGGDWNFGYDKADTPLVTIAHQDDLYFSKYTETMLEIINKSTNPIISFCHYAEVRNGEVVYTNKLLDVKKFLLKPLKYKINQKSKFVRRRVLSFGNSICCPAVTYVKHKVGKTPFTNNYKSNIDWEQWEILSRKNGSFVYCEEQLMGHRVHDESTTSALIVDNTRTAEDYDLFCKFWPKFLAKLIMKFYANGQNSNKL